MRAATMAAMLTLGMLGLSCGRARSHAKKAGELMEADLAFCRATSERGLEGWMSFFHPRATIFPASRPVVTGIDSISNYYQKVKFDPSSLKWRPVKEEMAASGELGFTYGYWELPAKDKQGKEIVHRGKYLTVWHKDSSGAWKVIADIGTN